MKDEMSGESSGMSGFARFAWVVLGYNLVVILWGAFVRATGSGAGCGSHWPLCNGEVVPRSPQVDTLIELTHRMSSGVLLVMGVILVVWAFRAYPKGHRVRSGAVLSMVFLVVEALLGAGLVLLEYVAYNDSLGRAVWMGAHLVNTFFLTGAFTLTAWWASGGKAIRLGKQGAAGWLLGLGVLLTLVLSVTGAITALGATLFPASSIAEGVAQDFSPTSPLLLRLRLIHPAIAVGTGLYLVVVAALIQEMRPGAATKRLALWLVLLFVLQLGVGALNLALHAPVWMQLVHLFLADLLWITLVLLSAAALSVEMPQRVEHVSSVPQVGD
ncbi:MAG: COX15/CtaA family protein [Chloroflexota bacterium]|nr:COX15/CtaA family protein [Chloroflexota bacterium]